tara:strand:+ start:1349 stop:2215 length:867 start_codon:yes stop_codon:yes gene_type:complete
MERLSFTEPPQGNTDSSFLKASDGIQVVLWNLYRFGNMKKKVEGFDNPLDSDIIQKIEGADFLLFQELKWDVKTEEKRLIDEYLPVEDFFLLGLAYPVQLDPSHFVENKNGLGIGLLSKAAPSTTWEKRTHKPERTGDFLDGQLLGPRRYKNALAATYPYKDSSGETKEILVVNLHNLVSRSTHTQNFLIDWSISLISSHNGPVIFGGDFNTWSFIGSDIKALLQRTKKVGLKKVPFHSPVHLMSGGLRVQLDHLFYKGLTLDQDSIKVFNKTNLSDHPPISVTFKIP